MSSLLDMEREDRLAAAGIHLLDELRRVEARLDAMRCSAESALDLLDRVERTLVVNASPPLRAMGLDRVRAELASALEPVRSAAQPEAQESESARFVRLAAAGGWIGVDLDGTLAEYGGFKGHGHIGAPIPRMVERVKRWLAEGINVRIVTARVSEFGDIGARAHEAVTIWCLDHIGQTLPVTCTKDHNMIELWDDRAIQVERNTGRRVDGRDG